MSKVFKLITLGVLMMTSASAVSTAICKGCHGKQWNKKAMGKSKVVKNMSKTAIINALKGYKNGSYGGSMKGLMTVSVSKISIADIKKIAEIIKK